MTALAASRCVFTARPLVASDANAVRILTQGDAIVKSAVAEVKGSLTYGDIPNHIFTLNTEPGATLTYKNEADAELAQDVPVSFACIQCHTDKDEAWVLTNFADIHASE